MDAKLVAWARAVKSRHRWRDDAWLPVLWVLTDDERLPDPRPILPSLPRGLCGVVLRSRHPIDPAFARDVARLCRLHRVALVQAGRGARGGGVGVHLGRRRGAAVRYGAVTASARGVADVVRADRSGADAVFISPIFATRSHQGRAGLGAVRWAAMARGARCRAMALGGVSASSRAALPRRCGGAGTIDAALPPSRVKGATVFRKYHGIGMQPIA